MKSGPRSAGAQPALRARMLEDEQVLWDGFRELVPTRPLRALFCARLNGHPVFPARTAFMAEAPRVSGRSLRKP